MEQYPIEDEEENVRVDFLHLPTEIHEQIIHCCGVTDVCSIALVNHQLHNLVQSKLRHLLIVACQNDYFEDIDKLYEFPEERIPSGKTAVIRMVRWDVYEDGYYDRNRAIYLLDHYYKLCLPWGHDIPWYQRFSSEACPTFRKDLLDCVSDSDIDNMITTEHIMVEQLSHYLAWPHFQAILWAEALLGCGFEYFLHIVLSKSVPKKRRTLPAWAPWPWDPYVRGPVMQSDLNVSDEIYEILCEVVKKPARTDVLVSKCYGRQSEWREVNRELKKTKFNDMWRVVI